LNKVPNFKPDKSSSVSAKPSTTTSAAPSPTKSAPPPPPDSKPNTVAVAVGVVVGVLALGAICFGVWFLLRRRRQKQAEEDYRRNAANVNTFVNGGKLHTSNSSMNDSRLDPSFLDRRQSNGSIADNEDYSRRILKVRCPGQKLLYHKTNMTVGYQRIVAIDVCPYPARVIQQPGVPCQVLHKGVAMTKTTVHGYHIVLISFISCFVLQCAITL